MISPCHGCSGSCTRTATVTRAGTGTSTDSECGNCRWADLHIEMPYAPPPGVIIKHPPVPPSYPRPRSLETKVRGPRSGTRRPRSGLGVRRSCAWDLKQIKLNKDTNST